MLREAPAPEGSSTPPQALKPMFEAVPPRYDLINRVLTLGLDQYWRKLAARCCLEDRPARVLDLCCGTGDLALQLARLSGVGAEIVGLDFSPAMLLRARRKAERAGYAIRFIDGDATAIEFEDGWFDAVGIAYAFRNLTWRNPQRHQALAEVWRVLKPGGRFVIVETSQPADPVWRALVHAYLKVLAAPLGSLLSGQSAAYRYLAASTTGYLSADEVCELLRGAGFAHVRADPLLGGAAAIHTALKSPDA